VSLSTARATILKCGLWGGNSSENHRPPECRRDPITSPAGAYAGGAVLFILNSEFFIIIVQSRHARITGG
jgi:hypothetical protein